MSVEINASFVATLVTPESAALTPDLLTDLTQSLHASSLAWLSEGEALDLYFDALPLPAQQARVKSLIGNRPIDIFIQKTKVRRKKVLLSDMESTLIQQEMIDELAQEIGLGDQVQNLTRRAMNGELDFMGALRERVALLAGQSTALLDKVRDKITLMPGAETLIKTMQAHGATCWLVSGGFTVFTHDVAQKLGLNADFANQLVIDQGHITGKVREPILDHQAKKALLNKAVSELGVLAAEIAAIGDGANDIPMLASCHEAGGLGVAYHAKPKVREMISQQINYHDLRALLFSQGYRRDQFVG